jgi:mRNA-degrading endonuclease toxin of MazEF toxin-antitoxin module
MPIRRGEVYFIDLGPAVGHEQRGRRPVVVVSCDAPNGLPLVGSIVPGTRGSRVPADHMSSVRIPAADASLPEETVFLTFHVRAVDHTRFQGPPEGTLSPAWMDKIDRALAWSLALQLGIPPSTP